MTETEAEIRARNVEEAILKTATRIITRFTFILIVWLLILITDAHLDFGVLLLLAGVLAVSDIISQLIWWFLIRDRYRAWILRRREAKTHGF